MLHAPGGGQELDVLVGEVVLLQHLQPDTSGARSGAAWRLHSIGLAECRFDLCPHRQELLADSASHAHDGN